MLLPSFLITSTLLLLPLLFSPVSAWVAPSLVSNELSDYDYTTNVTRYFVFDVTTGPLAPDGEFQGGKGVNEKETSRESELSFRQLLLLILRLKMLHQAEGYHDQRMDSWIGSDRRRGGLG